MMAASRESIERSDVVRALDRIWIAFQPIVRGADGRVLGYEALTRCGDPVLTNIGELLAAADELGCLHLLGRRIRQRAAEVMERHPDRGLLFLNLHPGELTDPELLDPDSPLGRVAERTVLEITERASLVLIPNLTEIIARLRRIGFGIAVDDLGVGYSGLSSLVTLRPDVVKIDMSLVRNIHADAVKMRLMKAITALCHELGTQVVAEGIEDEAERRACVCAGADFLQGYLIARPANPFPEVTRCWNNAGRLDLRAVAPSQDGCLAPGTFGARVIAQGFRQLERCNGSSDGSIQAPPSPGAVASVEGAQSCAVVLSHDVAPGVGENVVESVGEELGSLRRSKSNTERRQHPRTSIALDVRLESVKGDANCRTRDLSVTGLCLETSLPLAIGDDVTVTIELPGANLPIFLEAKVRWVEAGTAAGMQFMAPRARVVWAIQRYLVLKE
ncbi:MAG: EAL domain-containing protein [Polyangia bacterium]|jgi:EAL domain-containing protein (putative c-di-GMP-specific phosphodiesterase class I)|nr:EAL domain-containing protein [Polyangia bacterium]